MKTHVNVRHVHCMWHQHDTRLKLITPYGSRASLRGAPPAFCLTTEFCLGIKEGALLAAAPNHQAILLMQLQLQLQGG